VIAAAVLGTLALHGADALERKLLGRKPAYDAGAMGKRLFGSARAGIALRWIYGPALAALQGKLRLPPLIFGPAVALAELLAFPPLGATPPIRRWRREEVPLLFAHATAFALTVHALGRRRGVREGSIGRAMRIERPPCG
jgi:hypothetical protein